ncbi:MAG: Hsp33 family molecular chaperone HslO [Oscillospiraceae bacterium]|nr:Hsp33 family molecular chaperone HslO [Oscillospiraceae bacterium]
MADHIVRGITEDGYVKVVGITSTGIVERARQIHRTLPTATAALGRVLTAASIMGNMQKTEESSLTLQIRGGGPLGTLLAVSDWRGNVRGYVDNPAVSLLEKYRGKLDVGAAVGRDGTLTVIRDLRMKEPYVGTVPLVSGEIAEDVTSYFVQSEQIPTACALGVLIAQDQSVRAAGGYLIQLLPGAPDNIVTQIERSIAAVGNVTAVLDAGADARALLEMLFVGLGLRVLEESEVCYRCYCSRERVASTLLSLGREELQKIVEDRETVRIGCQFCDADYAFSPEEVRLLLQKMDVENAEN